MRFAQAFFESDVTQHLEHLGSHSAKQHGDATSIHAVDEQFEQIEADAVDVARIFQSQHNDLRLRRKLVFDARQFLLKIGARAEKQFAFDVVDQNPRAGCVARFAFADDALGREHKLRQLHFCRAARRSKTTKMSRS